jgi:excisionase family DNA binding protein
MFDEEQVRICEPLIDAALAGKILKLHSKTVLRMARAGKLPGIKLGRVWRFRESSLDVWLRARLKFSCHPGPEEIQ